jgi:hypothetical protein
MEFKRFLDGQIEATDLINKINFIQVNDAVKQFKRLKFF